MSPSVALSGGDAVVTAATCRVSWLADWRAIQSVSRPASHSLSYLEPAVVARSLLQLSLVSVVNGTLRRRR